MAPLPTLAAGLACAAVLVPLTNARPATSATVASYTPTPAVTPTTTSATVASYTPGCGSPRQSSRRVAAGTPWTQRRYPPARLAALATGAGVLVAVIDSGVNGGHPQLAGRVRTGVDLLERGGDGRRDCVGHGTAVASLIAAAPRAGTPVCGLAPQARILPIRVSEQQVIDGRRSGRAGDARQLAKAIRWSTDQGAAVINLSVVLYQDVPAVRAAVAYAVTRNVVVVAAVGNLHDSGDPTPYPAAYPGVLGVGAIQQDGTRADFSQTGRYLDLVAPGAGVPATAADGRPAEHDGTSYAVPFVSATAALLRQYRPELSATQIADRILASTDPAPGADSGYGRGVLNPYRAVTETSDPFVERQRHTPSPTVDRPNHPGGARMDRSHRTAALVGSVAAGLAGLALLGAVVLPKASWRRWSPPFG